MANRPVPHLMLPGHFASKGVQGNQVSIHSGDDELIFVESGVAIGAGQGGDMVHHRAAIFPQRSAIGRIHCLDKIAGLGQKHDAVMHQRRGFLPARLHGPGPGQAQTAHIGLVDLSQRAVAPMIGGTAPHQPVIFRRVLQVCQGYRAVVIQRGLRYRHRDKCGEGSEEGGEAILASGEIMHTQFLLACRYL